MSGLKKLFEELANEITKELESQNKKSNEYKKLQEQLRDKRHNQSSKIGEIFEDRKNRRIDLEDQKKTRGVEVIDSNYYNENDTLVTNDREFRGENSMQNARSLMEESKLMINRKTNSFTDTLYSKRNKVSDRLELESIEESLKKDSNNKGSKLSKKLRKKNAAREAFINSIIFERKI